jgi:hypothetical protein
MTKEGVKSRLSSLTTQRKPKKDDAEEPKIVVQEEVKPSVLTPRTSQRIDIDNKLISYGFRPQEKVVLKDDQQPTVKYIKGLTPNGIPALVELDVDALVAVKPDDVNVKEDVDGLDTPMKDLLKDTNMSFEIEGFAYECADGICTVTRDSNLKVVMKSLMKEKGDHEDHYSAEFYPIVKFSDLKSNSKLVLSNVESQSQQLRNELFIKSTDIFDKTQKNIHDLYQIYKEATELIPTKSAILAESIAEIQEYALEHQKLGVTEENMKTFNLCIKEIDKRNALVSELINIVTTLGSINKHIKAAFDEVKDTVDQLKVDFANIDGYLYE